MSAASHIGKTNIRAQGELRQCPRSKGKEEFNSTAQGPQHPPLTLAGETRASGTPLTACQEEPASFLENEHQPEVLTLFYSQYLYSVKNIKNQKKYIREADTQLLDMDFKIPMINVFSEIDDKKFCQREFFFKNQIKILVLKNIITDINN